MMCPLEREIRAGAGFLSDFRNYALICPAFATANFILWRYGRAGSRRGGSLGPIIYKICEGGEWREAERRGSFRGAGIDIADGYIHFSGVDQVIETAAKHFAGRDGLVLVAVDAEALGAALKWECSRGGALFPHIYAALPLSAVFAYGPLERDHDGKVKLPVAG